MDDDDVDDTAPPAAVAATNAPSILPLPLLQQPSSWTSLPIIIVV